jgi:hypothetical protein
MLIVVKCRIDGLEIGTEKPSTLGWVYMVMGVIIGYTRSRSA